MMGGEISASSQAGRGGSLVFTATFGSGSEQDAPQSGDGRRDELAADSLKGLQVLLAEDQPMNRQIAEELLLAVGASVDVAENGREAVAKLFSAESRRYDVILMDVQMPVLDGVSATRLIRSRPDYAEIPIIAMTAHVLEEERQICLAAGMNDFIGKPYSQGKFLRTLLKWVGSEGQPRPSTAEALAKRLPGLDGFDTEEALERFGGRSDYYLHWLRSFAEHQAAAVAELTAALAEGELAGVRKRVHAIAGQAGTLGIGELCRACSRLEDSLGAGEDCAAMFSHFAVIMSAALDKINAALALHFKT